MLADIKVSTDHVSDDKRCHNVIHDSNYFCCPISSCCVFDVSFYVHDGGFHVSHGDFCWSFSFFWTYSSCPELPSSLSNCPEVLPPWHLHWSWSMRLISWLIRDLPLLSPLVLPSSEADIDEDSPGCQEEEFHSDFTLIQLSHCLKTIRSWRIKIYYYSRL